MAYCRKCGAQIDDNAVRCPYCDAATAERAKDDDGSIIWGIIGFLVPIVGIIIWAVWHDEKPNNARVAIIGALISIILTFVIVIGFFVFAVALGVTNA